MSTLGKIGVALLLVASACGIVIAVATPGIVTSSETETLGPFTTSFVFTQITIKWWVGLLLLLAFVSGLVCVILGERRSHRGRQGGPAKFRSE
jgi:hypothetical protein